MRPTHRLDVLAVPAAVTAVPRAEVAHLEQTLLDAQVIVEGGRPGPRAALWMPEGFVRLYADWPSQPTLFANRQGGFSAWCPNVSQPITAAFMRAMGAWRTGGPRSVVCPACGETHGLEEVLGRPAIALGSAAWVTAGAEAAHVSEQAQAWISASVGDVRWVLRRG